jgi:large subunit ribosomal protein L18
MARTKTVPYRRRREDKTNYKKRIRLLLASKPRLVIRRSLKNVIIQVIEHRPKGDIILASAHSRELKKYGWDFNKGNLPSAYLTGLLAGKKATAKKCKEAILDLGLQTPRGGTRLFAALKGAIDGGLEIPHDAEIFPQENRLKGEHIANNQFVKNERVKNIPKSFEQCKEKIMKG